MYILILFDKHDDEYICVSNSREKIIERIEKNYPLRIQTSSDTWSIYDNEEDFQFGLKYKGERLSDDEPYLKIMEIEEI